MPKLSPAAAEARRRKISSAAHRCLLQKGFGRTTMRDIAREANLSLGGVYSHFRSKAELIQFLALQGRQETRKLLDHVPGGGTNLADLAAVLVRKLTTEECLRSVRVDLRLWGEALHTPELRKLVREAFASARAPMADAAKRARKLSPENTARVLLAVYIGLAVQKVIDPKTDVEGCARVVSSLLDGTSSTPKRRR